MITTLVLASKPYRVATAETFKGLGPGNRTPGWKPLAVHYDQATRRIERVVDMESGEDWPQFIPADIAHVLVVHVNALPPVLA